MKNSKIDIPIVLSFTPNYLIPAATMIQSILKNSKSEFVIYCLLSEALSPLDRLRLERLVGDRAEFNFIELDQEFAHIDIDQRYTLAAYYRLLLPNLLPEVAQVLYLDCDIIVQTDIGQLFEQIKFENELVAACYEATLSFQEDYVRSVGCQPGQYFNSGFMMMNLARMRQENTVQQFMEGIKQKGLQFPDQDVLNQCCQGRVLRLDPVFNSIRTYFLPQYKTDFLKYYTESDWEKVQNSGNIHYTGAKPWNSFTVKFDLWWKYYKTLPNELKDSRFGNGRIRLLYQVYQNSLGKALVELSQKIYRKMRYS